MSKYTMKKASVMIHFDIDWGLSQKENFEGYNLLVDGKETGISFHQNVTRDESGSLVADKGTGWRVVCANGMSLAAPHNGMPKRQNAFFWAIAMYEEFRRIDPLSPIPLDKAYFDAYAIEGSTPNGGSVWVWRVLDAYNKLEVNNGNA